MDFVKFVPCLVKTATNVLVRAKDYYDAVKTVDSSISIGSYKQVNLYGTIVEIRYDVDTDFNGNVIGIQIWFNFTMRDHEMEFQLTTNDDPSIIKERLFRMVNSKLIEARKFVDMAENFRDLLLPEIEY